MHQTNGEKIMNICGEIMEFAVGIGALGGLVWISILMFQAWVAIFNGTLNANFIIIATLSLASIMTPPSIIFLYCMYFDKD